MAFSVLELVAVFPKEKQGVLGGASRPNPKLFLFSDLYRYLIFLYCSCPTLLFVRINCRPEGTKRGTCCCFSEGKTGFYWPWRLDPVKGLLN